MKQIIYPLEIKTIFQFRNLEECFKNGLSNLIVELESLNTANLNLPIQYFGEIPMTFQFLENVESEDFENNFKDNNSEKKLFLIISTSTNIDIKKLKEKAQISLSGNDTLPTEEDVLLYYKVLHKTYLTNFLRFTQLAYLGFLWLDNAVVYSQKTIIDRVDGISSVLSENDFEESK